MTEEALFHAIFAVPAADRAVYLAEHCPNPGVRRRVEDLLAAHDRPAGPLDGTGAYEPSAVDAPGSPTRVGPYKLLQRIGEGGMGSVWMAEQEHPVRRRVAVKVIKPGMDSQQVLARFEAERQALALMDHPNIARVLDAGATDAGSPYFVMELVKGVPITKFCDENHLTPKERLELFVPVCQAIQHAHQKGVIHRDLKPSNVLVALYDDRPVPKVIDFGVAKAAGERLTDKTMFTEFGAVVGTLEYMSPEQAKLNQLDIDTRSDVYSLGVLLYELLTATTPLDRKRLKSAAFDEMLRIIREEEPPRPSTRLSGSAELPAIAAQRKTEPARLSRLVRGELDWIVMKALEKDRTLRYETASGLARDVERYLADEPVEACPPSAGYRLRKFVWKHRAAISTAALFVFVLVLFAGLSVMFAIISMNAEFKAKDGQYRAERAEQLATERLAEVERQRDEATSQRHKAMAAWAVAGFTVGSMDVDNERTWPEHEAQIRQAIGIQEKLVAETPNNLATAVQLGNLYRRFGDLLRDRGQPAAALDWYAKAIATIEPLHRADPDFVVHRGDLRDAHWGRAETLVRLGRTADSLADWDRAVQLYDEGPQLTDFRLGRALALARVGDATKALAAADQLAAVPDYLPGRRYDVACVYALAATRLSAADADRAADRAVTTLRQAILAGYRDIPHMLKDADLAALRGRADYAELLWNLADTLN